MSWERSNLASAGIIFTPFLSLLLHMIVFCSLEITYIGVGWLEERLGEFHIHHEWLDFISHCILFTIVFTIVCPQPALMWLTLK